MWKSLNDAQPAWGDECWITDGEAVVNAEYYLGASGYMWIGDDFYSLNKFDTWMYIFESKPDIPK